MKKFLLFAFTACITVTLMGQNPRVYRDFVKNHVHSKPTSVSDLTSNFKKHEARINKTPSFSPLKSAIGSKQRLDSIASEWDFEELMYDSNGFLVLDAYYYLDGSERYGVYKDESTYDSFGNEIDYIYSVTDDNNQWVKIYRSESIYDENGNYSLSIGYDWINNKWEKSYKNETVYDESGIFMSSTEYEWINNNWENSYKAEMVNHNNGNYEYTNYYWENGQWINDLKYEQVIDEVGQQYTYYSWTNSQWLIEYKSDDTYDENGEIVISISQSRDEQNELKNDNKWEYTYDDNFNRTSVINSQWINNNWLQNYREEYSYDNNGNQTQTAYYIFDSNLWKKQTVIDYVFDETSNLIERTQSDVQRIRGEDVLVNYYKTEYVFDNAFTADDLIIPRWMQMDHKLIQESYFFADGDNWLVDATYNYYYSEQNTTGIDDDFSADNLMKTYPNPAFNEVTFSFGTNADQFAVEFYNVQGKQILNKMGNNNIPVPIESLNDGLYFYRLTENNNFYTGKIVIQK